MRRTFDIDVNLCQECGGKMKLISLINEHEVIKAILESIGLSTAPPIPEPLPNTQYKLVKMSLGYLD